MSSRLATRSFGGVVAFLYFGTNVALASAPESTFWAERRKNAQRQNGPGPVELAGLPAAASSPADILRQLPSLDRVSRSPALSQSVTENLPQSFIQKHADLLNALSHSYGAIRHIGLPIGRDSGKIVIHIQDVHQNEDAQKNIGQAVQALIDKGQTGLVALEGAFRPIALGRFRAFPDHGAVREAADFLLRENKISGPIHAAFTSAQEIPPFIGVDDPAHYAANVEAYKRSAPHQAEIKARLATEAADLDRRKIAAFSPALKSFDGAVAAYRDGKGTLGDYVRALSSVGHPTAQVSRFLEALAMEQSMDFKQVESERSLLVERLVARLSRERIQELADRSVAYRAGCLRFADFYRFLRDLCRENGVALSRYPAMDGYIRYVLAADRIDAEKLFDELSVLEVSDYARLAKTKEEERLVEDSRRLALTGKLVDFSLSSREWGGYQAVKNGFTPSPRRKPGSSLSMESLDLASFESFYNEAQARDDAMAQNLLRAAAGGGQAAVVLVTGGYHSDGIAEKLRKAGFTVVSFTPNIEIIDVAQGSAYLSVFTREKTPLEKLFEGQKLFLAGDPVGEGAAEMTAILPAVKAAGGISTEKRSWSESEVDRDIAETIAYLRGVGLLPPNLQYERTIKILQDGRPQISLTYWPEGKSGRKVETECDVFFNEAKGRWRITKMVQSEVVGGRRTLLGQWTAAGADFAAKALLDGKLAAARKRLEAGEPVYAAEEALFETFVPNSIAPVINAHHNGDFPDFAARIVKAGIFGIASQWIESNGVRAAEEVASAAGVKNISSMDPLRAAKGAVHMILDYAAEGRLRPGSLMSGTRAKAKSKETKAEPSAGRRGFLKLFLGAAGLSALVLSGLRFTGQSDEQSMRDYLRRMADEWKGSSDEKLRRWSALILESLEYGVKIMPDPGQAAPIGLLTYKKPMKIDGAYHAFSLVISQEVADLVRTAPAEDRPLVRSLMECLVRKEMGGLEADRLIPSESMEMVDAWFARTLQPYGGGTRRPAFFENDLLRLSTDRDFRELVRINAAQWAFLETAGYVEMVRGMTPSLIGDLKTLEIRVGFPKEVRAIARELVGLFERFPPDTPDLEWRIGMDHIRKALFNPEAAWGDRGQVNAHWVSYLMESSDLTPGKVKEGAMRAIENWPLPGFMNFAFDPKYYAITPEELTRRFGKVLSRGTGLTLKDTYDAGRRFFRRFGWQNPPDWVIEILFAPVYELRYFFQPLSFLLEHKSASWKILLARAVGVTAMYGAFAWLAPPVVWHAVLAAIMAVEGTLWALKGLQAAANRGWTLPRRAGLLTRLAVPLAAVLIFAVVMGVNPAQAATWGQIHQMAPGAWNIFKPVGSLVAVHGFYDFVNAIVRRFTGVSASLTEGDRNNTIEMFSCDDVSRRAGMIASAIRSGDREATLQEVASMSDLRITNEYYFYEVIAKLIDINRESAETFLSEMFVHGRGDRTVSAQEGAEKKTVVLASQSPRRRELLDAMLKGRDMRVSPTASKEYLPKYSTYESAMMAIALSKALMAAQENEGVIVAGDTTMEVVGDYSDSGGRGDVFGKIHPQDQWDHLKSICGKTFKSVSSLAVVDTHEGKVRLGYDLAYLRLKPLSSPVSKNEIAGISQADGCGYLKVLAEKPTVTVEDVLAGYARNGRGVGKANGFGVQDRDFFLVVDRIEGDPLSVIGFPQAATIHIFNELQVPMRHGDFLKNMWPSPLERQKILVEDSRVVEARVQNRKGTMDEISRCEVRLTELTAKGSDRETERDERVGLLYKLIKLNQAVYRLHRVVRHCADLSREIRSDPRHDHFKNALERIVTQFNPERMDPTAWDNNQVPLDDQTRLFRLLDDFGNAYNGWTAARGDLPIPREAVKPFDAFDGDPAKNYLGNDQYREEKEALIKDGFAKFRRFLTTVPSADAPDADLWDRYKRSFEEVTTANISSDLSRGEGISEDQLFALRDDRDAVIDRLKNLNPGRRSVVIAFDNVGYESFAVLWQAYLLLRLGFKVTLFGKANPMLRSDATDKDIALIIPYFNGMLAEKFGRGITLIDDRFEGQLSIRQADMLDPLNQFCSRESVGCLFLTGEMWYGYLVGVGELLDPPFNKMDGTAVFSMHTHKNIRQRLAMRDDHMFADKGRFASSQYNHGRRVYQLFAPKAWVTEKYEFNIKDCEAYTSDGVDRRLFEQKLIVQSCRAYLGIDEPDFEAERNYDDGAPLPEEIVYKYRTPVRFVKIKITRDKLTVEVSIDCSIKEIREKNDWGNVMFKIPELLRGHLLNLLKREGRDSRIVTDEEERIRRVRVICGEEKAIRVFPRPDVFDIEIPMERMAGGPASASALADFDGSLFVQVLSDYGKETLGNVLTLYPAYFDAAKQALCFSVLSPAPRFQIQCVVGMENEIGRTDIVRFTDPGWMYQLQDGPVAETSPPKVGYRATPIDPKRLPKVFAGPIDIQSAFPKRVAIAQKVSPEVGVYSDLVRIGNLFSPLHIWNKYYFFDTEYRSGLPRMSVSSNERYAIVQLAGPHDLPAFLQSDKHKLFHNPDEIVSTFVKAAVLAEFNGASAVDLNMGSPTVDKGGVGGAYFTENDKNQLLAARIVREIRDHVRIPVCVKTRIALKMVPKKEGEGMEEVPDYEATERFIRRVTEAGADWVALHTRIRTDGYNTTKPARRNWGYLKRIKERNPSLRLIGNGDISTGEDARAMFQENGIDGVMIAQKMLSNPFLLREAAELLEGRAVTPTTARERFDAAMTELRYILLRFGDRHVSFFKLLRSAASFYVRGEEFNKDNGNGHKSDQFLGLINKATTYEQVRQIMAEAYAVIGAKDGTFNGVNTADSKQSNGLTLSDTYEKGRIFFSWFGWHNPPDWVVEFFFAPVYELRFFFQPLSFLLEHDNQSWKHLLARSIGITAMYGLFAAYAPPVLWHALLTAILIVEGILWAKEGIQFLQGHDARAGPWKRIAAALATSALLALAVGFGVDRADTFVQLYQAFPGTWEAVKPILYWIVGIHGIYNVVNAVVRKFTGFSAQLTKSKEGSQAKPEVAAAAKAGAPLAFVETGQEALVSRYAEVLKLIGEGKTVPPSLVAKLSDARSLGLDTADANSVILEKAAEDLPPLLTQPKLHSSFMESLGMDAFSLAAKLMEGGPEIAGHRLVVRLVGDREEDIREALAMATTVGRLGGSRWSLVLNARDPGVLARLRAGTAGLHSVYFPDDSALGKKDWKATKVSFQKSGDIDPDAALEMIRTFKQILPSELWSDLLALVLGPVQRQDILIRLKAATVVLQYA